MTTIVALDCETLDLPDADWEVLKPFGDLVRHAFTPRDEAVIVERCRGARIVLSNKVPLMEPVLRQLPELKLICVLATGTNNVDLEAARRLGITVRNVPSYSTQSVAQHAVAMLLELTNRTGHYNQTVHSGEWVRSRQFTYWHHQIMELAGKTAGIVGFGEIGRATAALLQTFGMRIIASTRTRRNPPDWEGFRFVDMDELFATADVISLHCPQTPENTGFVDSRLLGLCKPTALLLNTARGPLINEQDLRKALESGTIAGAGLDVLSAEPMRADSPLLGAPNCIITPHIAWASVEARQRLMATTVENIRGFLASK